MKVNLLDQVLFPSFSSSWSTSLVNLSGPEVPPPVHVDLLARHEGVAVGDDEGGHAGDVHGLGVAAQGGLGLQLRADLGQAEIDKCLPMGLRCMEIKVFMPILVDFVIVIPIS